MVLKCFPCAFHYSPIWIQHCKCTPHSTAAQTCHSSQATLPDSLQLSCVPPTSHPQKPTFPSPTHPQEPSSFLFGSTLFFFSQPSGWWVTSHLSFSTPFLIDPHVSPGTLLGFLAGDFCSYFFLHFGMASIFAFFCVPSALATHHALPALILSALLSFMCQRMAFPSLEMSFKSTLPLHQRLKKRWAGLTGRIWKICLLSWWKQLALVTNV